MARRFFATIIIHITEKEEEIETLSNVAKWLEEHLEGCESKRVNINEIREL